MTNQQDTARDEFEKWMLTRGEWACESLAVTEGMYRSPVTRAEWVAYQAATASAEANLEAMKQSMQRWIDFHNERADAAEARYRDVLEKLVEALEEAQKYIPNALHKEEGFFTRWWRNPTKDKTEDALLLAAPLLGRE